jgi:competence ComEA-like helix-hairpin-helix protein
MRNKPNLCFRHIRSFRSLQLLQLILASFFVMNAWAIDVNQASLQALQSISGIGPKMALRIVTERARGPFESMEHLAERVSGLGEKRIKRFKAAGLTAGPGLGLTGQGLANNVGMPNVQSGALKSGQVSKRTVQPSRSSKTQAAPITPEIWLIENAPSNP